MATETKKTEVGSYFISNYPPYSAWKSESLQEVTSVMQAPPAEVPLGLYLHIPFCRKRCKFCYFRVFTDKRQSEVRDYLAALDKEIELVSKLPVMGGRPFRFVYFGGGTPSFLAPRQLEAVVDSLRKNISWDQAEEVTFECEPGTLTPRKVKTLKEIGITRLSLGVENFHDGILEENGRAHLSGEVYKAWDSIVEANFDSVNIDLIAGMVGETWDNWKENIRKTIEMSPDSVTIYQMELPFNTVISQGVLHEGKPIPVADWTLKREWVDYAFAELEAVGYEVSSAYTMVKKSKNVKFSYRDHLWKGSDLLATGIASFGHVSGVHYQNLPDWKGYMETLTEKGELPLGRAFRPTEHQLLVREMILQMKKGWLDVQYFQNKFGVNILSEWQAEWDKYKEEGWLSYEPDRIQLTREGLLRVDGLLPAFFEAEHQGIRYT
ncbi:Oxygen-independent coproporphyrinogen III oxidase [Planctomycetales bacterium 10988]|nr:Oxygen-independent coproporphyrinogen III oxidase [Planctomycetales bacterium 10988]